MRGDVTEGLVLTEFGVAFGSRRVLRDITTALPRRGMSLFVGPVASGKSTLLRTLAGLNHAQAELRLFGRAEWDGTPLFGAGEHGARSPRVALVLQKARFFVDSVRENLVSALANRSALDRNAQREVALGLLAAYGLPHLADALEREVVGLTTAEQRRLAVVRAIASEPDVLLADEPTAGIDDESAQAIMGTLAGEAGRRCVVVVTHQQQLAKLAGGITHLLVDGTLEESTPTERFFAEPTTGCGRHFIRTGGYAGPERVAKPSSKPPTTSPPPRGFLWLVAGRLGGLPRPGLIAELEHDLAGLEALGIQVLVGLEETRTIPEERLRAHGLTLIHFPIPDMGAPAVERVRPLFERVEALVDGGHPVAFHCRAGLGRTGTMLAGYLVWRGWPVGRAIEHVRGLSPHSIQSLSQVEFLRRFELARTAA